MPFFAYPPRADLAEGQRFPNLTFSGSLSAVDRDGTIYTGSWDGNLYAVNSSSLGLANSTWPMFLHDAKHTGRITTGNTSFFNLLLLD